MEFFIRDNEAILRKLEKKISELETTNQELRILTDTYQLSFENITDILFIIDMDLKILSISPSVEKILGYKPQDFVDRSISDLGYIFTPKSFEQAAADAILIFKGKTITRQIYEFIVKDGTIKFLEVRGSPIIRDGKVTGMVAVARDITRRKQDEEQIKHMSTHDGLTDLPILRLAKDRLSMAINMACRYKKKVAVMFIDLDDFKVVNDTLGHDAGDYVLKQVAQRLLSCVRETDTVARVGGDEFLIIAAEINTPENVAQMAKKVIQLVSQPIIFDRQQAVVSTSIGIALFPDHGEDMDQLIKLADEAMYRVKNAGKNGFRFVNTAIK